MRPPQLTPAQQRALATALQLEERYRASLEDTESLRSERNGAVRDAIALGVRASTVGRHLDLTPTRIGQIKRAA